MSVDNPWLLLAIVAGVAFAVWFAFHSFSRSALLERRRRRNNKRIVPKVKRPVVRLSVRTPRRRK